LHWNFVGELLSVEDSDQLKILFVDMFLGIISERLLLRVSRILFMTHPNALRRQQSVAAQQQQFVVGFPGASSYDALSW
jgi:hypothetical protein